MKKEFICYFHFISWTHLSLGFHIDLGSPNIEIHLPFGFIRLGWQMRIKNNGKRFGLTTVKQIVQINIENQRRLISALNLNDKQKELCSLDKTKT